MKRPQAQVAVLQAADSNDRRRIDAVADDAGLKPETATRAAFELEADGLLAVTEETIDHYDLTEEGQQYVFESLLPTSCSVQSSGAASVRRSVRLVSTVVPAGRAAFSASPQVQT